MLQEIEKLMRMAESNEDLQKEVGRTAKTAHESLKNLVALGAKNGCNFEHHEAAMFLAVVGPLSPQVDHEQIDRLRQTVQNLNRSIKETGPGIVASW